MVSELIPKISRIHYISPSVQICFVFHLMITVAGKLLLLLLEPKFRVVRFRFKFGKGKVYGSVRIRVRQQRL